METASPKESKMTKVSAYRTSTDYRPIPAFVASAGWSVPTGTGSSYSGTVECGHAHRDIDSAQACEAKLARKVERSPRSFPAIVQALDAVADAAAVTA